jgi:hypothetical protein
MDLTRKAVETLSFGEQKVDLLVQDQHILKLVSYSAVSKQSIEGQSSSTHILRVTLKRDWPYA